MWNGILLYDCLIQQMVFVMADLRNDRNNFFEMKSRHSGRSIFSVPFDKETVKYVLHGHRLSTGCRSSTNGSRIIWGLRGDVHPSWFTRSTRRAVCTDQSGRPKRCVKILDRNVTQWKQESTQWKLKALISIVLRCQAKYFGVQRLLKFIFLFTTKMIR